MFETLTDRIAGTLLSGLDVAVEFATLGEFRLVDPELALAPLTPAAAPALPLVRRPARSGAPGVDRGLLPGPSTAVARASRIEPQPERVREARPKLPVAAPGLRCDTRRRRAAVAAEPPRRPSRRKRAGAVGPAVQLCLLPE